jgi:hypothetical protein
MLTTARKDSLIEQRNSWIPTEALENLHMLPQYFPKIDFVHRKDLMLLKWNKLLLLS